MDRTALTVDLIRKATNLTPTKDNTAPKCTTKKALEEATQRDLLTAFFEERAQLGKLDATTLKTARSILDIPFYYMDDIFTFIENSENPGAFNLKDTRLERTLKEANPERYHNLLKIIDIPKTADCSYENNLDPKTLPLLSKNYKIYDMYNHPSKDKFFLELAEDQLRLWDKTCGNPKTSITLTHGCNAKSFNEVVTGQHTMANLLIEHALNQENPKDFFSEKIRKKYDHNNYNIINNYNMRKDIVHNFYKELIDQEAATPAPANE